MKNSTKEMLRGIGIAAFGGFGVWETISESHYILTHPQGGWLDTALSLGLVALVDAPFFIVAYICFRRKYRELFNVLAVVGAVVIFGVLISLPQRLHIQEYFVDHVRGDNPWGPLWAFVGFPVSLLCLFGPLYAAQWLYRWCRRMARPRLRLLPADEQS